MQKQSQQSTSKRKSEQLSLTQHEKLRQMMMKSNFKNEKSADKNDFQIKHYDQESGSNQADFSVKSSRGEVSSTSEFQITMNDNPTVASVDHSQHLSKLIEVKEEYDIFSGQGATTSAKISAYSKSGQNSSSNRPQINQQYLDNEDKSSKLTSQNHKKQTSHSKNASISSVGKSIIAQNYMDEMIVEDSNDDEFERMLQEKRRDQKDENSMIRGSFMISSPQTDFDYFDQRRAESYSQVQVEKQQSDFKISSTPSYKAQSKLTDSVGRSEDSISQPSQTKGSQSSRSSFAKQVQNPASYEVSGFAKNSVKKGEAITINHSSKPQAGISQFQVQQVSSEHQPQSFQVQGIDILQQVEAAESKEQQDNYMDDFFGQEQRHTYDPNRNRNRRTSPLGNKFQSSEKQGIGQSTESKYSRPQIIQGGKITDQSSTPARERLVSKVKIQDQDMLDGDFKIDEGAQKMKTSQSNEAQIKPIENNIQKNVQKPNDDSTNDGNVNRESESQQFEDLALKYQSRREESRNSDEDFLKIPRREKSPDIESINEDTLDESAENTEYLLKLKEIFNTEAVKLGDKKIDQIRKLNESITNSIIERIQQEESADSLYNPENQILNVDDEILRLPKLEDFQKEYYLQNHQEALARDMTPKSKKRVEIVSKLTKDEWDYKDVLKIIDWNERRHKEVAHEQLKQNSVISLSNISTKDIRIRVLTPFQTMNSVSNKMLKERSYSQARATAVALTDSLILVGNTEGQLWMFDRESEEEYSSFSEKSKDFLGNSVTAIDVHTLRPEYVVLGYERGQLVLIDIQEPKKSIKVIKDHHKLPIINLKFCDWQDGGAEGEDKQAWMFVSIDQSGQVLINTVSKILFIMKASKHVVVDPMIYDGPIYASVASRFQQEKLDSHYFHLNSHNNTDYDQNDNEYNRSYAHGQNFYDSYPFVAMGNAEQVDIIEARSGKHNVYMTIKRPNHFYNKSTQEIKPLRPKIPSLAWGFGSTPAIRDKGHSILTIAWGPLIQLVALFDSVGTNSNQPFIEDGYYVIRNFSILDNPFAGVPEQIQSSAVTSFKRPSIYAAKDLTKKTVSSSNDLNSSQVSKNQGSLVEEQKSDSSKSKDKDQENKAYDESEAFTQPGMDIEQIQFFSDSTILIVTKSQEIRILNIAAFNPSSYNAQDEKQKHELSLKSKRFKGSKKKDQSFEVELEYGLRISSQLQKSEYGALYHQTIKFFKGKIIALTIKNIQTCTHLTWQQSVYEFKKIVEDDLVMVFSRALDIYKGNVRGYSGIPDKIESRENQLKEEIKLLVREIIQQVIQKTRISAQTLKAKKESSQKLLSQSNMINPEPNLLNDQQSSSSEQQSSLSQSWMSPTDFKDEQQEKYKTLIRIAIEFCVELKDQRFLFFDLFLLFKREKLEDAFVHELEPFIMAGRFSDWELPNEVIQNHVLKYYKDSQKADQLEKIIVNLNLAQCPKTIVLEFIHYAEQNFLTTAILFLYTQVFEKKDSTSCVQIIFSLFDLYKKAGKKNQGLLIDIQNLKEFSYDSKEKVKVEKSQIYLGYKILWVIKMFLNGQKFPQGHIKSSKWRTYIHDILDLLQSQQFLKILLDIDAEQFFQTISIVFMPGRPFQLFESGREIPLNDSILGDVNQKQGDDKQKEVSEHAKLVKAIDGYCMNILTKEAIKYQYLFFASNVIAKSDIKGLDGLFYYTLLRELLQQNKRLIENNKKLQSQTTAKYITKMNAINQQRRQKNLQSLETKVLSEMDYLVKTEADLLNLLSKSEPMDSFQILELSKLSEQTQFYQLKILLMEKRQEYLRCLNMFLNEFKIDLLWTEEMQKERVIKWIREKTQLLESKAGESPQDKNFYEQFKREVQQNIAKLLAINAADTIHLIEDLYQSQHKEMINSLSREPKLQLQYLDILLMEKKDLIEQTIKTHGLQSSNTERAKRFIELLKQHLRLCCQFDKDQVLEIVQNMVKDVYYPIEDCLEICQEFKILQATFLLNRKVGKYYECIEEGLLILKTKTDFNQLLVELYHAYTNNQNLEFPVCSDQYATIKQFDTLFKQILKICRKNYKEVEKEKEERLWYMVCETIQSFLEDPIFKNKAYGKRFFRDRLYAFSEQLVRAIPFQQYMEYQLTINRWLRLKDFGEVIKSELNTLSSELVVLSNANAAVFKFNSEMFDDFQMSTRKGMIFRQRLCVMCKRYMDSFLYDEFSYELSDQQFLLNSRNEDEQEDDNPDTYSQPVKIFACQHTFHLGCLERHFRRRKKNESDIAYQRRIEKLRCPTCNLKTYELESMSSMGPRGQRRTPRSNAQQQLSSQGSIVAGSRFDFNRFDASASIIIKDSGNTRKESAISGASNDEKNMIDKTELWEKQRQMNIQKQQGEQKRKMELIQKKMERFEVDLGTDGLGIKDFKIIQ